MALTPRLEFRQSQSLVMTPQLLQAIKLLQMSNLDLTSYVENELESNPLLERSDVQVGEENGGALELDAEQPLNEREGDAREGDWLEEALDPRAQEIASKLDTDVENLFPESSSVSPAPVAEQAHELWSSGGSGASYSPEYNLEAFVASETTMRQFLIDQMQLALRDPVELVIGQYMIDSLDEAGYLRVDIDEIASRLNADRGRVEHVLRTLQTFEPTGVFATSLHECLALQLKEKNRFDPIMEAFVQNIELLGSHDYAALKRICDVDDDDLMEMICEVKRLDPKPCAAFGGGVMQPVAPDVVVSPARGGGWAIELNNEALPKVLVNQLYYATVTKTIKNETEKAYLVDCLQTANWLVKSLDQRARTILKVSTEIVRQQDGFLLHGVQHLRPLNLKTVAEAIGMHESTVSRVTSNKFMATSRGVFELKYFFSASISSTANGDAHSAEAVRDRIRRMIDAEDPDAVLSDDAIVKFLMKDGVDIARRTVAKYREAMKIGSSVQRRREKRTQRNMMKG